MISIFSTISTISTFFDDFNDSLFFFGSVTRHPDSLRPEARVEGWGTNSHAPGPRGLTSGGGELSRPTAAATRCPRVPRPGHGRRRLPHLAAGPKCDGKPTAPGDFSSRTHPPRGGPLRVTPPKRGLSEARTAGPHATHGWHTIEALVTRTHSPRDYTRSIERI